MQKPAISPYKIQRNLEAMCRKHDLVGVALLMEPVEAHQSAPVIECAHSDGNDLHRSHEFAAAMLAAVHRALRFLRPDLKDAG